MLAIYRTETGFFKRHRKKKDRVQGAETGCLPWDMSIRPITQDPPFSQEILPYCLGP